MNIKELIEIIEVLDPDIRIVLRLPEGASILAGVHLRAYMPQSKEVLGPDDPRICDDMEMVVVFNPWKK